MTEDELIAELAGNAGEYAVRRWGLHLPKSKQLRLWKRHRDGALAAMMALIEIQRAERIRRRAFECLN